MTAALSLKRSDVIAASAAVLLTTALMLSTGCGSAANANAPKAAPLASPIVAMVQRGTVERTASALGTVAALDQVVLATKAGGIVTKLPFTEGATIVAGTLIAELDLAETTAAVREADAALHIATVQRDKQQPLVSEGVVSDLQMQEAEANMAAAAARLAAAQARLDDRRILAPFAGRIGLRRISVGALVAAGTPIASLASVESLKIEFSLGERDLERLAPGQAVRARTSALPGRIITGTVTAIDATVDTASRTVLAYATVPNADGRLQPGMSVDVEVVLEAVPDALTVPEEAVVLQGPTAAVFVIVAAGADGPGAAGADTKPGSVVKRQVVKLGTRTRGRVEVLDGLNADAQVVVQGTQFLRDGQMVTPKPLEAPATPATPTPTAAPAAVDKPKG